MFKLIPWSTNLNLDEFYAEAARRGFDNNSSQKKMIDCLRNEKEWAAWILYLNDKAIGSVAAHSFDDVMGPNSYRICVRTCVLHRNKQLITNKKFTEEHQHISAQFYFPVCINWAGENNRVYITSNNSSVGSQRLVHNIYMPTLSKKGLAEKVKDTFYRNTFQTVWEVNGLKFLEDLKNYPRWS